MNLFQKYLVDEFVEDYQENRLSRREALKMIGSIVGSMAVASSILAACAPLDPESETVAPTQAAAAANLNPTGAPTSAPISSTASPQPAAATVEATATSEPANTLGASSVSASHGTVTADDPAVNASAVTFPGRDAELQGYLARPSGGAPAPVILVCHENRGLTASYPGCRPPVGQSRLRGPGS